MPLRNSQMIHEISDSFLSLEKTIDVFSKPHSLVLSISAKEKITNARAYLDNKVKESQDPIYGINTGFGSLCNVPISSSDLEKLQENLIISHACGAGEVIDEKISKIILFLKIQSLSYGHSGVSLETIERLIYFYNHEIIPIIYSQGSLGASGDLAPLAHLSLPLIGKGEVIYKGKRVGSEQMLRAEKLEPLKLQSKEGLALLNGTQFISGHALYLAMEGTKLIALCDEIAALSMDGFDARIEPFDALIGMARSHPGHIETAARMRERLKDSEIIHQKKEHVQDPYSFRCIPQVHGASKDAFRHFVQTLEIEINSVTDNPNIFPKEDKIISGGNFHAQPLAMPLDYMAIALSELANISERRIYLLVSGQRNLPPYLVAKPGLNSGFMIMQYTAASIVSQNKQYATPASVDSIVSSNGQEDHVSMGANAATKAIKILDNLKTVLSIEALTACQALDFRNPLKTSAANQQLKNKIRKEVAFLEQDEVMYEKIIKAKQALFEK